MSFLENSDIGIFIFSKLVCLSFIFAFLSLLPQVLGLFGSRGILSIDTLLGIIERQNHPYRFWQIPSIFWLSSSDRVLYGTALIGLSASTLAFLGFASGWMLLLAMIVYLSFCSSGQDFMGFQWDALLLEAGYLALLTLPFSFAQDPVMVSFHSPFVVFLIKLLLFKLMFCSGLVKLASKDISWRNLTALHYHFWTQPLPSPVAWYAAKLPSLILKLATALSLIIELFLPFFIFLPSPYSQVAFAAFVIFQLGILITGNYTFFNLLALGLCAPLLSNTHWLQFFDLMQISFPSPEAWGALNLSPTLGFIAVLLLAPLSLFWILLAFSEKSTLLQPFYPIVRSLYYLRLNNNYGLFAAMTKNRPELVLEGSDDGEVWQEYVLKYKPVLTTKKLCWNIPHQPRLDWQMWFAALGSFTQNMWLQNLMIQIFWQSPEVIQLFAKDPFPDQPPRFLRLQKYEYRFSTFEERKQSGDIWQRTWVGPFGPVFDRDGFEN